LNAEPAWSAANVKLADVSVEAEPSARPPVIVVCGATPSIFTVRLKASDRPALSVTLTESVWTPSVRPDTVWEPLPPEHAP
jgi:hypothetical protein